MPKSSHRNNIPTPYTRTGTHRIYREKESADQFVMQTFLVLNKITNKYLLNEESQEKKGGIVCTPWARVPMSILIFRGDETVSLPFDVCFQFIRNGREKEHTVISCSPIRFRCVYKVCRCNVNPLDWQQHTVSSFTFLSNDRNAVNKMKQNTFDVSVSRIRYANSSYCAEQNDSQRWHRQQQQQQQNQKLYISGSKIECLAKWCAPLQSHK